MGLRKGAPALIAVLLAALSLTGCATSLNSKTASASSSMSSNSKEQEARIGTTPRQGGSRSNDVTITGAVNKPGIYPYTGRTLLQFVAVAGGFTPESNSTVRVLRQSNGTRSAVKFNVPDLYAGRVQDPTIRSGDIIVAETSGVQQGLDDALKILPLATFRPF